MKCPYCFKINRLRIQKKKGSRIVYYCSWCKTEVPKLFLEASDMPYRKIGMLGYSGHGKTIYNLAMLSSLKTMPEYWNGFYVESLDEVSHQALYIDTAELQHGRMFQRTRAVYPRPVFLQINNMPQFSNQFISLFDTGGRMFDNLELMTRRGRFLSHSEVIFFFISLAEEDMLENWNLKIMKLLDRYINVIYSRYGIKTKKKQNIVFILTKSDKLIKLNGKVKLPDEVVNYYENGSIEKYRHIDENTITEIKSNSDLIESWLRTQNCNSFINFTKDHFKNSCFVMSSALPYTPKNGKLDRELSIDDPKCILDPLLWAMHVTE